MDTPRGIRNRVAGDGPHTFLARPCRVAHGCRLLVLWSGLDHAAAVIAERAGFTTRRAAEFAPATG
jgi:hypothetical protein